MRNKRFLLLFLCIVVIGIFTTACGGGGGKSTPPNYPFIPVPTPAPTVSPTPAPTVSPTPEPTPTPTPEKYDLELSQTEFTVNVGATDNITVTLNGEDITQTATYTVDQEAIASVEGGLITGLSVGVATVTVHADESKEDKTFTVNVIDPTLPTLEVEPSEVNLIIEETANVTVTLEGKDVTEDVKYDVDEKSIATVEKGVVKAKYTGGTANITVALEGANSATFKVNVTDDTDGEVTLNDDVLNQLGYKKVVNGSKYDIKKITDDNIVINLKIPAIYPYEGKKNKITSIGDKAFFNCFSLKSVEIPNSVTTIKDKAFNSCTKLESVTIGDSVNTIAQDVFNGCSSLKNVTIGDNVLCIFPGVFKDCSTELTQLTTKSRKKIKFPTEVIATVEKVTFIGVKLSYSDSSIEGEVIIPDGVTEIPECALFGCASLESVTIPDSVTSIGYRAFTNCASLESVTIPDSVTSIGDYAFFNCGYYKETLDSPETSHLTLEVPSSVTSIGSYAFYHIQFKYSGSAEDTRNNNWGGTRIE